VIKAPEGELPAGVAPRHYKVSLVVDPTKHNFDGHMRLDVQVDAPTRVIWLHGSALKIKSVAVRHGQERMVAKVEKPTHSLLGLVLAKALPAGQATIEIDYTGVLSSRDSDGASRQQEGGQHYVYTELEPIDARRVFPCFDEPRFKVPWQLTLKVRDRDQAFSNTLPVSETPLTPGWRAITFAPTKPLPSYLIAFAVGPFEVVEGGRSRRSGTPVRIITPRGQAGQTAWAAKVSAEILSRLEDYFDQNYDFGKLDNIAVPLFRGAMENPGLVTFGSGLILRRPQEETPQSRRSYAGVAVHELAHQWFGNLVTNKHWDELWLNEAFATWITQVILETWQPTWGTPEDRVASRLGAMRADSLVTARRIRQPIQSEHDIKNAFDAITYQKGAAVIRMFERWVGPDRFQKGIRTYMRQHANGNATAADLLAAISTAAGREIAPAFSSFLDQEGVPVVSMALSCPKGQPPVVELAQERYLPRGSTGATRRTWQIPLCVRHGKGKKVGTACTLLTETRGTLPLTGVKGCPAWLLPNQDGAGYYHAELGKKALDALLAGGARQLSVPERLAVIGDLRAQLSAGKLPYDDALRLVPALARDRSRHVVEATVGLVAHLRDSELVSPARRPAYARFIRQSYGARARQLGWLPHATDDEDTRILRAALLPLVADQGEDARLQTEARALAQKLLRDPLAVPADIADAILEVASHTGDAAWFDALYAAARNEGDLFRRRRWLGALSAFRNPALVQRAMAAVLSSDFQIRESMGLLWGALRTPATRALADDFVRANYDTIVARLPRDGGAQLPYTAIWGCNAGQEDGIRAFYEPRNQKITGGPRVLAQALERLRICSTLRRLHAPQVERFFAGGR
jgi:alanyl aminopeptidase